MGQSKEKWMKKVRKKRIWPSVVVFIVFLGLCFTTVSVLMELFVTFIIGNKLENLKDAAGRTTQVLDELVENGWQVENGLTQLLPYLPPDTAIVVHDSKGREICGIGSTRPDMRRVMQLEIDSFYTIVADDHISPEQLHFLENPIPKLLQMALREDWEVRRMERWDDWRREELVNQFIWIPYELDGNYTVYTRVRLNINKRETTGVLVVAVAAAVIMALLICYQFISMIRFIIMQRRTIKLLYWDSITGGKNWLFFQNAAERIINGRIARKRCYAVINLHLERYQNYCACYGVAAGEELLERIDVFLKARTTKKELYARYEGADYGILIRCEGATREEHEAYARKRVRTLLVELMGTEYLQTVHFLAGIYMIHPVEAIPRHIAKARNVEVNQIYNYACAARAEASKQSTERIYFFNEETLENQIWERKVEDNMLKALQEEEFQVYVQPKFNPMDNRMVGGEALVRWISPTEGFISPGQFIPIFENNGFITKLDDYMISHLAKMQAQWTIEGKRTVPISVNVSRAHFAQEGLAEHICQLVDAYGAKHELIELEVTESAFFDDKEILVNTVRKLKEYGFAVSMDDFGAGYSSLNSLKDIPLDVLKLDGEFFRGEEKDRGEIVVKQAIAIAKSLNMKIVAEGIEKKEQVEFLADYGCDMIQGFYFAKPMPVAEFEQQMEKNS